MPRQSSHLLFLCIALMVLLPPRVQAALPKELPAAPAKFLTGACLTRTEDLWITAEAGGIGNVPNRRLRRFGNSRRIFAADVGFQGKNVRSIHGEIIHPRDRALPRRPVTGGREPLAVVSLIPCHQLPYGMQCIFCVRIFKAGNFPLNFVSRSSKNRPKACFIDHCRGARLCLMTRNSEKRFPRYRI